MIEIYHYNPATGEYLEPGVSSPNPADPETPIIPAFATIDPPPEIGERQAAVFRDAAWSVVDDYRGTTWWRQDGMQYTIDMLGIAPIETDTYDDPRPSMFHEWTGVEYVLNRERWLDAEVRPIRDGLLNEADLKHCNAEKWESLTPEDKSSWTAYKQALRDLPGTIDYDNPVWPTRPA